MKYAWFLLLLAGFGVGCHKHDEDKPASASQPPVSNVQGVWTGTLVVNGAPLSGTFTLTQSGSDVSGTAAAGSLTGTIQGKATGNGFDFRLGFVQPQSCPGNITGSGSLNGNSLSLAYSRADCNGTSSGNGTFSRTVATSAITLRGF